MQQQRGTVGSFTETSEVGQQRTVGSFTETHELLHGTSLNNTGGGQQHLCNIPNQAENRVLSHHPSELEGRRYGLTDHPSHGSINLSLSSNQTANDSSNSQSTQFGRIPLDLNAVYAGNSSDTDQVQESDVFPHQYKPGGSEANDISTAGGPGNPSGIAFGSAGHVTVEGDGRPGCSSDGRRLPCKRKADDDVSGQLSQNGSPREQPAGGMVPARSVAYSSNAPFLTENSVAFNQQLPFSSQYEVGGRVAPSTIQPVVGAAGFPGDTQRSSRLRSVHGHLQDPQLRVIGRGRNGPSILSPTHYHTRDVIHIPGGPRTVGPLSEASSTTRYSNLASIMVRERPSVLPVELYPTNMPRAIQDLPMHNPTVHSTAVARHPTDLILTNANISLPGRPDSITEMGSSSRAGLHTQMPPNLSSSQHTLRLEGIRRTLLLATDSDSDEETIGPVLSPAISQQGNPQLFQGPVFGSDLQDDDVPETHLLSRALNAGRENRRRLLSEVRPYIKFS
ncbi:hypothetical protein AQUCO_00700704v1 [Aquilegia coerulea]|uniref:Uncharacterized protein n=1 Tax=Aquilegia coerulea TaxID=218851 RepID=A0A2G5ELD7_AQUCA|nr:hypothetical protein AQUCO_00700704v1 [Aquilegia coerulea]PIA56541.1 hypothetical protein AQUCO_00700704v1 [Aquilegia coerulea]